MEKVYQVQQLKGKWTLAHGYRFRAPDGESMLVLSKGENGSWGVYPDKDWFAQPGVAIGRRVDQQRSYHDTIAKQLEEGHNAELAQLQALLDNLP